MLLKLQNAITLSLTRLVDKAVGVGGKPKHIELPSTEAFDLLREICANKDIRTHYSYDGEGDTECGLGFRLNENLDQDGINEIANAWHKRKVGIRFDDIPLYIVVPKVKKVLSKKFSRKTQRIR